MNLSYDQETQLLDFLKAHTDDTGAIEASYIDIIAAVNAILDGTYQT